MTYFLFLAGFLLYVFSVCLQYVPALKSSSAYYAIGLSVAIAVNLLWLTVAKLASDGKQLYMYGIYWDAMIVASFSIVPVLFYGVRISGYSLLGLGLILTGTILTKVG